MSIVDCRSEHQSPIWQFTHSKRFPCGPEHANDRNVTRVGLYLRPYCTVFVLVFYCIFTRIVLYLYSCFTVFLLVLYCICTRVLLYLYMQQADLYLIAGLH